MTFKHVIEVLPEHWLNIFTQDEVVCLDKTYPSRAHYVYHLLQKQPVNEINIKDIFDIFLEDLDQANLAILAVQRIFFAQNPILAMELLKTEYSDFKYSDPILQSDPK